MVILPRHPETPQERSVTKCDSESYKTRCCEREEKTNFAEVKYA